MPLFGDTVVLAALGPFAVGLAVGAVLALIGAGGAIIAVPALVYLFGFDALAATTASLAVVAVSSVSGVVPRLRAGEVDIRRGVVFWLLGVGGALGGTVVAHAAPQTLILVGFAVVMAAAAVAMWHKSSAEESQWHDRRPWWLLVLVALGIGFLTGVFGVGGGFLIVPALVLVFGFPFGSAVGTSLLVVALNSATTLLFRYPTWTDVSWHVPIWMIVGGLVGSIVVSHLPVRIPTRILERAFAVLLVLLAAAMTAEELFL